MAQIKEETKIIKVMECFSLSSVRLKSRAQYGANLSCRLSVSRWPYSGHGQWTRHIYRALYACVNISVHVKHLRHWQPYCCLETGKSENRETEREGRKGVRVRITQQHRLQQHSFWQLQRVNNVFFFTTTENHFVNHHFATTKQNNYKQADHMSRARCCQRRMQNNVFRNKAMR